MALSLASTLPRRLASSQFKLLGSPLRAELAARNAPQLQARGYNVTPVSRKQDAEPRQGLFKSLLHGSDTARGEGMTAQSHSTAVGRNKYVHEISRVAVQPAHVEEYKKVLAEHLPKIASDPSLGARLVGAWEVVVGDLETFYMVWEFDGYAGYDASTKALAQSEVWNSLQRSVRPLIASRSNWMAQEFGFWQTSPPNDKMGGIVEWRTYHLKPGMLLEWETNWRRGLEARRKFVEPVAAFFTQIGGLHTVHHLWHYPDLDTRKVTREAAWQVETWNDTVSQTVKLIDKMHAQIMKPLPFSPLR
ncbi:NIPSNAP-domain-containing protein [Ceraceosorus guamensis]|uniref:NIPSNAP-domain-containing protein n=1 Tax=Ceraceosorus guamensis TaxID=1522189 RepID=A0A316W607_9BASI|nr:NIPSNAP-domain-containing protein [Ceraceosorus guamensis]PWN45094.1 NIPSNAP-domain-containing protein [Ceraceosorus guamensis]